MKFLATFLFVVSLLFSSFFTIPPKKAEAFLGDSVSGTAQLAIIIADMAVRATAQAILQRMIDETVNWASSGFEGNPSYVQDPKQFFGNIADGVAGEIISGSDLAFLCSPFQFQVRMALRTAYVTPRNYQCTFSGAMNNLENFFGDFNDGGWATWHVMTQRAGNNPYGAFLEAQAEMDSRLASAMGVQEQKLSWDSGFLGQGECDRRDDTEQCTEPGRVTTPGSTIKSQLEKVLPSTMDRFINAQHLEDLLSAFVIGALNRYVFNSEEGLFNSGGGPTFVNLPPIPPPGPNAPQPSRPGFASQQQIDNWTDFTQQPLTPPPGYYSSSQTPSQAYAEVDLDGDLIYDATDTNGDGIIDTCYFGGFGPNGGLPCYTSSGNPTPFP